MTTHLHSKPAYVIRDAAGNALRHTVLPHHATLTCRGDTKPYPYRTIPDDDTTRRAHEALGAMATRQLPMGSAPPTADAGTIRNELGRMESPLAMLCWAVKERAAR